MASFQLDAKVGEARGELPVAEDRRVVQRGGLASQSREVVDRIENHRMFAETSVVRRHDLALRRDHDAVDVALDADRLERERRGTL